MHYWNIRTEFVVCFPLIVGAEGGERSEVRIEKKNTNHVWIWEGYYKWSGISSFQVPITITQQNYKSLQLGFEWKFSIRNKAQINTKKTETKIKMEKQQKNSIILVLIYSFHVCNLSNHKFKWNTLSICN